MILEIKYGTVIGYIRSLKEIKLGEKVGCLQIVLQVPMPRRLFTAWLKLASGMMLNLMTGSNMC